MENNCRTLGILALGFSFTGEVRQPFVSAIEALKGTRLPIVSGNEFGPRS